MSSLNSAISDTTLRRRLIIGSVSLAVVVSIIFIIVAYRLSSDLAKSTEVKHFDTQYHWLFNEFDSLHESTNDPALLLSQIKNKDAYKAVKDNVVAIEIMLNTKSYSASSKVDLTRIHDELKTLDFPEIAKGTFELEQKRLFWQFQKSQQSQFSLLVVYKLSSLEEALDYVAKRLSITAFLTFWLAIWAALTMSAIITKRFEDNNKKLAFLAMHDSHTGLKNRTYLREFFNENIESIPSKESPINGTEKALLIIDLNKFKDVNDTFGHGVGDELLKIISQSLRKVVDEDDLLVRYGGDEFIVWFNNNSGRNIQDLIDNIIACCAQPIPVAESHFEVGASIGIAYYPKDGDSLDILCKHADIAMYQAKKLRSGFEFYQKQLPIFSERQVRFRGQLTQAIASNQFVLFYQTKVTLKDGLIVGAEALARWQHPVDGLLGPVEFIDLIEQSDAIHSFSRFVITEAVRQASKWKAQAQAIPISINLSAYNLADPQIFPFIQEQLDRFQLAPNLLEVELTESATMVDIDITKKAFIALRAMGVKVSIDDFGTGMSSFSYLRELDIDFVKIDRSFIADMLNDQRSIKVVKGIISMCHSLDSQVVAEGIETQEQADKLKELGCKIGQGYFFGKPAEAQKITDSTLSSLC